MSQQSQTQTSVLNAKRSSLVSVAIILANATALGARDTAHVESSMNSDADSLQQQMTEDLAIRKEGNNGI